MGDNVTKKQAEQVLAAVKVQFKAYIEPMVLPAEDGMKEMVLAGGPEPVLVMGWTDSGAPAIVWEEGPEDWAMRVSSGEPSEEERVLFAAASAEFGAAVAPSPTVPAKMPKGVWTEPYNSWVLSIYPA